MKYSSRHAVGSDALTSSVRTRGLVGSGQRVAPVPFGWPEGVLASDREQSDPACRVEVRGDIGRSILEDRRSPCGDDQSFLEGGPSDPSFKNNLVSAKSNRQKGRLDPSTGCQTRGVVNGP